MLQATELKIVLIVCAIVFFQEALIELEELKEIVPKESLVYFLIGKVSRNHYWRISCTLSLYIPLYIEKLKRIL